MKFTILIIDDDEKLNQMLKEFLSDFDFNVLTAFEPDKGLKILKEKSPDLIILDIMLPQMNGFEVCKTIRKTDTVPIIMLTARGEVMDKVVGLELGADDYLPKPFEPRELVARIQSILRRTKQDNQSQIETFGRLAMDYEKHVVLLDGKDVGLTTNEFTAFSLLVKNAGKVLNRDQILDALRGMECEAFNRSVDITMSRIRQKLKDNPKNPSFIKTIWGTGYLFIGERLKYEV
jgi:DNA-binding response OmpR family regulator